MGLAWTRLVSCPVVKLGGTSLALTRVLAAPLSSLKETLGRPVSMILGQDAFATKLLEIDLPNRKLSMGERLRTAIPPAFRRIALTRGPRGRRCITVSIEGVATPAIFDLGSSNPVMLARGFAARGRFLTDRRLSSAATRTLAGIEVSTTCLLQGLTVAGFSVRDAPAEVFSSWSCRDVPANVGLPIFQDFRMVVDFAGDSLWLARIREMQTPFKMDRSGLGIALERNCLRVVHVALGSPAEASGWRIAERITAVDGQLIGADYVESGLCQWRYGDPGRVVTLRTPDGRSRHLILSDYV